jgi:hypothetical protein
MAIPAGMRGDSATRALERARPARIIEKRAGRPRSGFALQFAFAASTLHHEAMKSAIAWVVRLTEERFTRSSQPWWFWYCIEDDRFTSPIVPGMKRDKRPASEAILPRTPNRCKRSLLLNSEVHPGRGAAEHDDMGARHGKGKADIASLRHA